MWLVHGLHGLHGRSGDVKVLGAWWVCQTDWLDGWTCGKEQSVQCWLV